MKVVFRADASTFIGTGHVMRCLSLALALAAKGAEVAFVCREFGGHLCNVIEGYGFRVLRLPPPNRAAAPSAAYEHSAWLGVPVEKDAAQTISAIRSLGSPPAWVVVDHYALDASWEQALRSVASRLMVIDDLADRPHECDLLIDSNIDERQRARYLQVVPGSAMVLTGPRYALVRPEFARLRAQSLRRRDGSLRRLLVFMGGGDPDNETSKVLAGIRMAPSALALDVVIGDSNPHATEVREAVQAMSGAELHVQTTRMAELMTQADCAITSGGSVTWERCALGLPAIVSVTADNQRSTASAVAAAGAQMLLGDCERLEPADYRRALADLSPAALRAMSAAARDLCDGRGAQRVACRLLGESEG